MISQQQLEGHWDDVKAYLQKRWGHLTDEELQQTRGDRKLLIGALERRTGLSRDEIVDFLDEAVGGAQSAIQQATATASYYAERAGQTMRDQYGRAADALHGGYEASEECIRQRPIGSIAAAFGAGIILGVIASVALCRSE